jgi:hypothetical protein
MTPRSCYLNLARDRAQLAIPTPAPTFRCACCGKHKAIPGRKMVGRIGKRQVWHCAGCLGGGK